MVFIPHSIKRKVLQLFRYQIQPLCMWHWGTVRLRGWGASSHDKAYTSIIHSSLKERYRKAKYHNFAKSGAILNDVIHHQLPRALAINPSLITISVGANDIIRRTKPEEFEENLYELLKTLQQKQMPLSLSRLSLISHLLLQYRSYSKHTAVIRQES